MRYCGTILLSLIITACAAAPKPDARIFPDEAYGCTTRYFFQDLKGYPTVLRDSALTDLRFARDRMNGVRISIYGDAPHPAHPAPGHVDATVYATTLASLRAAREAYGKDDFTVFASKKLAGKNSFPKWVMGADGIDVKAYTTMLMDYFRFMRSEGVQIDVLGIDNETDFNEGNISARTFAAVVDLLKPQLQAEGFKIPLFIGPERYKPQTDTVNTWMTNLYKHGFQDRLDIYGSHYYPRHHKEKFRKALAWEIALSRSDRQRPFWATEPHWDNDSTAKADMLGYSEKPICTLFDQTDLGMEAIMWWGYGVGDDLRTSLIRAMSLAVYGARPVRMEDHDGEDTLEAGLLQTRAYRCGDELRLVLLNLRDREAEAVDYPSYCLSLEKGRVKSVQAVQWRDDTPKEGGAPSLLRRSGRCVSVSLPNRSITVLRIKI